MGFGLWGQYKPVNGYAEDGWVSSKEAGADWLPLCMPREVDARVAAFMKNERKRRRHETMLDWLIVGGTGLAISAVMLFLAYIGLECCGCFDNIREIKQQIDKAKATNTERTAFFEWRSR